MDLLPTFCALSGAKLPKATIDGFDITPLLFARPEAKTPYEAFYYYRRRQLQAIRWGDWKWHLPLEKTFPQWTNAEIVGPGRPGKLIDLGNDLQEKEDLTASHPEVMDKMRALATAAISRIGNEEKPGREQRNATTLTGSKPMTLKKSINIPKNH